MDELTGLTKEEREIIDLLVEMWNKYLKLEDYDAEVFTVQDAVNEINSVMMRRIVRRLYPSFWQ